MHQQPVHQTTQLRKVHRLFNRLATLSSHYCCYGNYGNQFENILSHQLKTEFAFSLPKIISKCCELVKLCHINHSSPVFTVRRVCIVRSMAWQDVCLSVTRRY